MSFAPDLAWLLAVATPPVLDNLASIGFFLTAGFFRGGGSTGLFDLADPFLSLEAELFLAESFWSVFFSLDVVSEAGGGFIGTADTDEKCSSSKPLIDCSEVD